MGSQSLKEFIKASNPDGLEQTFLDEVEQILRANDVTSVKQLARTNPDKLLNVRDGPVATEGKRAFVKELVEKLQEKAEAPAAPTSAVSLDDALAKVLEAKQPKKLLEVNMQLRMDEVGLGKFFPLDVWPSITPVRQMATWAQNRKRHIGAEYVFVDIKKCDYFLVLSHVRINFVVRFLPPFCADRVEVDEMPDQETRGQSTQEAWLNPPCFSW